METYSEAVDAEVQRLIEERPPHDYIHTEHEPVTVADQSRWYRTSLHALEPFEDEPQTALEDLLANLRHYAQRVGLNFEEAARVSEAHWEAEQPRKGPPSRVPNLDALDDDALELFALRHENGRSLRELFPEGGAGTRVAATALAEYAGMTFRARLYRREGRIADALKFEDKADAAYQRLPVWARW